jgi:hypothetical protein
MKRKIIRTIALGSFALVVVLGAAWQAQGTGHQNTVSEHGSG